ncbi:putative tonB-dependent siderophore receptor [Paraburkholderia xenovorans LB400]|nr:putative tonB-dependent siderophore receptor [Paraburkholderia xenovorans LB400]
MAGAPRFVVAGHATYSVPYVPGPRIGADAKFRVAIGNLLNRRYWEYRYADYVTPDDPHVVAECGHRLPSIKKSGTEVPLWFAWPRRLPAQTSRK